MSETSQGQGQGHGHTAAASTESDLPKIDVNERGAMKDGQAQTMNRRLFMQLLVFTSDRDPQYPGHDLALEMAKQKVPSVIYQDANDPYGLGLLTWAEDPALFVEAVRPAIHRVSHGNLKLRPEFTMLGRSYSTGYEPDLEFALIRRPQETVLHPDQPWAIWYPLRRSGAFAKLEPREQGGILREHATIGRAYGGQDLAHDVRLACHGLDAKDNEFVIGLVGKELHPLSHIVQSMRKTRQTAEFISQMGPFFVGRAAFRNSGK